MNYKTNDAIYGIMGFAVFVLIIACVTGLVKCDGSNDSSINLLNKEVNVTLVNGSNEKQVTAVCNKELTVDVPVKSKSYFLGYYDSESGGNCYINNKGKASSIWQEEFPTKLYAHWGSIYDLKWDSEVRQSDEPYVFGFYDVSYKYVLPTDFQNAIKGNLNEKLKVTIHFAVKQNPSGVIQSEHDMYVVLKDGEGDGAEELYWKKMMPGSQYEYHNFEFTIDAGGLKKGDLCVMFDLGYANTKCYIKDVSVSVAFGN